MKHPIVALLTDFGEDDFFVASVKGAILQINPSARIVDITHQVSSFDIPRGSFLLSACYRFFPSQTIFLVVVDPGVGSSRKILAARTGKYFFIGPDNGVLSHVLDSEGVEEIREVCAEKFFLKKQSRTFEARDKMAPAAAWISRGVSLEDFGPPIKVYEKLDEAHLEPRRLRGSIEGSIVYSDRFGNLITNIPVEMVNQLQEKAPGQSIILYVGKKRIDSFVESYASRAKGELFFLDGSIGLVEVAARESSAKKILKARVGDPVRVRLLRT